MPSDLVSLILYVLAFFAALQVLHALLVSSRRGGVDRARTRLRRMADRLRAGEPRHGSIVRDREGPRRPLFDRIVRKLRVGAQIDLLLYRAGVSFGAYRFVVLCLSIAVATGGLARLVGFAAVDAATAGTIAFCVPFVVVWMRKRRRMAIFDEQLVDALELMARSLRAGHALSAGFAMVAEELPDPIAGEFAQVSHELRLGLDLRVALANLVHRIDSSHLPFFATAALIQRETGGNLAEVIDKLGHVIRERHKFQGKVRAMTAQNKFAAHLLAGIAVSLVAFLWLTNREFLEPLFTTEWGRNMFRLGVGLIAVGYAAALRLAVVRA